MDDTTRNPFEGQVPEVSLPDTPLVKVLAQLRYPRPLDFDEASINSARKALGSRYPVNREAKAMAVLLTPDGGVSQQPSLDTNWLFEDIQGNWKVTLADRAVAIETTAYTSRNDFCERLSEIINVVGDALRPPVFDRLGIRYINRLEGTEVVEDLSTLVQPVALAGLVIPHDRVQLKHSLCDTLFIDGNSHLQVRWGWLPAESGIDQTVTPPSVPYWLLDIDSFTGSGGPFEVGTLDEYSRELAERAHRFFRWAVTDKFLERFGGQL